jgi:thiol-disulfide isomerase/thioredoxin
MLAIDWKSDFSTAFALAKAQQRPLFLYWGADWCPPCNRIKSIVLRRPDFIELMQSMVPLHIDGDAPGAQQLAERFNVRNYPTLIVFRPDGTEVTRLPYELEGDAFVRLLRLATHAPFTVAESVQAALSGERTLLDDEWRLLAYYSWETDEQQVLGHGNPALLLANLTRTCTLAEASVRLAWHAMHAAAMAGMDEDDIDIAGAIAQVEATLADKHMVRDNHDLVTLCASDLVRFLTLAKTDARVALASRWGSALEALETDESLPLTDQLAALRARVRLSRLGAPIPGLNELARARVASAINAATDPALRHTIINTAAGLLSDAGLLAEAETLLLAELNRSHAPFYFMHNLATIAKKRGDPLAAVSWYEQAWKRSTGPATRLQWGTTYLHGLIDFAPHDAERIEQFARVLLREVNESRDSFYQRNRTQMQRIDQKLATWGVGGEYAAALRQAARVIN